jgi:hypothetical protein
MATLTRPEMAHLTSFVEEMEALIDADTEDDPLIPLYIVERVAIIKQILEEKLNE